MLPEEWTSLNQIRRKLAVYYLRYLCFQEKTKRIPLYIKLTILHGLVTLITLNLMPSPPNLPPVALPIVWGASLGTTITLYALLPIRKYL